MPGFETVTGSSLESYGQTYNTVQSLFGLQYIHVWVVFYVPY